MRFTLVSADVGVWPFNNLRGSHVTWAIILFQIFCRVYQKLPFPFSSPFSLPPPPPPPFVRIFTFRYSLVLSVDIQRTSALIEVMFWLQIVLIRHRSQTQLLFHLGRRNWLKNESNALRSMVNRPPAKRMHRVCLRNYRHGKGKSPREESAEKFCSTERPEWQRRLKNTRRNQPIVAPKGPSEDSAESVPSFMKEFEKKKRACPRGKYFSRVETN